jgi:hypothetical protein
MSPRKILITDGVGRTMTVSLVDEGDGVGEDGDGDGGGAGGGDDMLRLVVHATG